MRSGRLRPLAARIASPSAFSVPTWALAFAPSVTTAVLHDRNLYGGSLAGWALAAAVGAAAAGLVLLLIHAMARGRHPLGLVIAAFLLAGAARGVGVGATASALGLVPQPQLEVRALSGALLAVFWLSISTVIIDGVRRHRATRLHLQQLADDAEHAHRRSLTELASLRSAIDERVIDRLDQVISRLDAGTIRDEAALREIAHDLHELSAEVVRPLSHASARPASDVPVESPTPRPRARAWTTVLRDALSVDPFHPGWTAALLFPAILMTAIRAYGVLLGVVGAAWIAAMASLVLIVARAVPSARVRSLPEPVRAVVVIGTWLVAGLSAAVPVAIASTWGLGPERAWAVFGVPLLAYVPVTCAGVAVAIAIQQSWAIDADEQRARIEELAWRTTRMEQQVWAERLRIGRFLHGSVQSALTSTALLIELSLAKGVAPVDVARQASQRLHDVQVLPPSPDSGEGSSVPSVLDRIADVWARLARITITITDRAQAQVAIDRQAGEHVVEIVREALSNAVRHGRAANVEVLVDDDLENALGITVVDDGHYSSAAATGLGTSTLEALCLDWSREPTGSGGTRFTCRVPTEARGSGSRLAGASAQPS